MKRGLSPETVQVLHDLNAWWTDSRTMRPEPPTYARRDMGDLKRALARSKPLIQVLRGPRQVGKATAL
jgi:predicted AAA+ superfamily ATPase